MGFKINRKSISDQLVEHFSKEIRAGKYKPGDEFPSERTLEQQLGVSRKTIGKVVSILAAQGYLFKEQGCTTYVADFRKQYAALTGERCFGVLFYAPNDVYHPASSPVFLELCNVLREAGYGINLNFLQRMTPVEFLAQSRLSPVAGYFAFAGANQDIYSLFSVTQSPVIILREDSTDAKISSVSADVIGALGDAIRLLKQNGRKRIAFLYGNKKWEIDQNRISLFLRMTTPENRDFDPELLIGSTNYERGKTLESLHRVLQAKPDAIISADDMVASWVIEELTEQKFRIPEDIAVIGFNDMGMFSQRTKPELTTFAIPAVEIAQVALKEMLERINNPNAAITHTRIPMPLLRRGTL